MELPSSGCEANHPPPFNTKIENEWNHDFTPPYAFMVSRKTAAYRVCKTGCSIKEVEEGSILLGYNDAFIPRGSLF